MNLGNNNLTGSSAPDPFSRSFDTESDLTPSSVQHSQTSEGVTPINFLLYEGIDLMTSMNLNPQQFPPQSSYEASAQIAILVPPDSEGQAGPQPYEPAAQRLIKKFFSDRVLELLKKSGLPAAEIQVIYQALMTGQPVSDPNLAQIAAKIGKQVTGETQEQARLSASWSITSNVSDEWIPSPLAPGEVNIGIVNPQALAKARFEMLFANIDQLGEGMEKAALKIKEGLGPHNPNRVSVSDFIEVIASAIRELKKLLQDMQVKDAEKNKELAAVKYDRVKDKEDELKKLQAQRREQEKQRAKSNKIGFLSKILGPTIAGVVALVSVALAVASGGSSLIAAAIIIGIVMTTFSVVDTQLGLTQKLVAKVNDFLAEKFDDPALRAFIKALLVTAAVCAVAVVFLGGSAAVASITTSTAVAGATTQVGSQLFSQTALMAVMSSNAIPELISSSLMEFGAFDEDQKMMVEMIIMAIVTIAALAVAARSTGKIGETATTAADKTSRTLKETLNQMAKKMEETWMRLMEEIKSIPDKIVKIPKQIMEMCRNLYKQAVELVKYIEKSSIELLQSFKDRLAAILKPFKEALDGVEGTMEQIRTVLNTLGREIWLLLIVTGKAMVEIPASVFQGMLKMVEDILAGIYTKNLHQFLSGLNDLVKSSGIGMQVADGIIQGRISLNLARILEDMGETEYSLEMIQSFVKSLEKILASFQTEMTGDAEALTKAGEDYNSVYEAGSRIGNRLFHIQG